jgi:hypothetical protein
LIKEENYISDRGGNTQVASRSRAETVPFLPEIFATNASENAQSRRDVFIGPVVAQNDLINRVSSVAP